MPAAATTLIPGQATADATKAYVDTRWQENPKLSPDSWRLIEGLTVAKIGLGTYRMGTHAQHIAALEKALLGGLNLIDTASNYQDGAAETLIGQTLHNLIAAQKLRREEVVLVTKAGYIQGQTLARLQTKPFPQTDVFSDTLAHCLHPDFLADQLQQSQQRLGVAHIDIFLLHNPEYALQAGAARDDFYNRITAAFTRLETFCRDGLISYYGVSSNSVGYPADHPLAVDLARLAACADTAAQNAWGRRKRPLFRVLQMPLNLLETEALFTPNTQAATFQGSEAVSALELAARRNMTVLTNRPLNAFIHNRALRLSTPETVDVTTILAAVKRAEDTLAAHWGAWPQYDDNSPALRLGDVGRALLEDLHGRVHADQVAQTLVYPTADMLMQLDAPQTLRAAYATAVDDFVRLMNAYAAGTEAPTLTALRQQIVQHTRLSQVPLQQLALNALTSLPGVTCVLLGARRPQYVDDALKTLELADFADPAPLFSPTAPAA